MEIRVRPDFLIIPSILHLYKEFCNTWCVIAMQAFWLLKLSEWFWDNQWLFIPTHPQNVLTKNIIFQNRFLWSSQTNLHESTPMLALFSISIWLNLTILTDCAYCVSILSPFTNHFREHKNIFYKLYSVLEQFCTKVFISSSAEVVPPWLSEY